ncbi:hypothetical protein [Neptunomonas antarctica]|nr:hypothetical protein [Neptunomonas antarctica]
MSKLTLTTPNQSANAPTDPLTERLRSGARQLIAQAVEHALKETI